MRKTNNSIDSMEYLDSINEAYIKGVTDGAICTGCIVLSIMCFIIVMMF